MLRSKTQPGIPHPFIIRQILMEGRVVFQAPEVWQSEPKGVRGLGPESIDTPQSVISEGLVSMLTYQSWGDRSITHDGDVGPF